MSETEINESTRPLNVYFAGELFDHKHLTGNALLAMAIEKASRGRYLCVLPQDIQHSGAQAAAIRDRDLKAVLESDLALFNFDGAELDSGTVAEFMLTKFLDIPAVVFRTDFRAGGDQHPEGQPWNLMCSYYPRTQVVNVNALDWYREAQGGRAPVGMVLPRLHQRLAGTLVDALDKVRGQSPVLPRQQAEAVYDWALRFPGGGLASLCDGLDTAAFVKDLVTAKQRRGLL